MTQEREREREREREGNLLSMFIPLRKKGALPPNKIVFLLKGRLGEKKEAGNYENSV